MADHKQTRALAHPKYRADIDGLRAIAVLTVIVYHAFPSMLPGGFIGVDIFFVISGFLISSIIFSNLEHESFSIIEFYNRRIRRIFPALLLVLMATLTVGWFILLSEEYEQMGWHVVGGAAFASNLVLWAESGYFDTAATSKPLLHLWSLGIEEQFYLLWPLLLIVVWRKKWNFLWITLVIAAISFALNIYLAHHNLVASFYSPFTRFWELMIGGSLAYIAIHHPEFNRRHQNIQSAIGFGLLGLGLFFISDNSVFPGWWALLPSLGACFILSAGPSAWLNRQLLANKVAVWIGLLSYPLYLWHWPLLTYARIVEFPEASRTVRLAACVLAVVLAWLTFALIEKHVRSGRLGGVKSGLLLSIMFLVGSFGYYINANNGIGSRSIATATQAFVDVEQEGGHPEPGFRDELIDLSKNTFEGQTSQSVLFIGDSLMGHYYPRVADRYYDKSNLPKFSTTFAARGGCRSVPFGEHINSRNFQCDEYYQAIMKVAQESKYSRVVFSANWRSVFSEPTYSNNIDRLMSDLRALTDSGKQLFIISMAPHSVSLDPRALARPHRMGVSNDDHPPKDVWINRAELESKDEESIARLRAFSVAVGATLINPFDYLCTREQCPAMIDGRPLYIDEYHLKASTTAVRATFIDEILSGR